MNKFLFFVVFFCSMVCYGQEGLGEEEKKYSKIHVDIDFEVLRVSAGFKFAINEKVLVGPSLGLGAGIIVGYINDLNKKNNYYGREAGFVGGETSYYGITFKFIKSDYFRYEIEPRIVNIIAWTNTGRSGGGKIYGLGVGCFFGGKKVQIGFKTMIGLPTLYFSNSFIIIRIPLKLN